ncbi:hypothetical protein [Acaryochloris sp. CCMEE 5410]|uniref:hypothetical protein n=1 Tax=Acaryochloris sp. CCMEE 5410 TaxID=310037 RepID=UPI0002483E78|nr:hypothetical protein [Acaryochloris sp. CCMEE 5410]KAI9133406.1 hypothetical protein ON05_008890 [Acaryochloris sp. CCMEE 5410]
MQSASIDNGFIAHDIDELFYTRTGLRLILSGFQAGSTETAYMEVFWSEVRGFRFLDEGDLIKYWETSQFQTANCVYEIISGGWLYENVPGVLSVSSSFGFREYLVATSDPCMSILANEPPILRVYGAPYT